MKVLVAEDNEDIAYLLAANFNTISNVEATFRTAQFDKLLNVKAWEGINVALLDYHLSEPITGLEIATWLSENLPHIRRVIFSAMVMTDKVSDVCHAVLRKPFTFDELMLAIGMLDG